jgi:regulator of RNase E activity RraB
MKNRKVLEALTKNGDNHSIPRDVDHFVYFQNRDARSSFVEKAAALGYKCELIEADRADWMFGVQLVREQAVEQSSIDKSVMELVDLAERFGGDYDGWGCTCQP